MLMWCIHINIVKNVEMIILASTNNYKNPLGEMTIEDLIEVKENKKVHEFLSVLRITEQPCPPKGLRPSNGMCFYCHECFVHCLDQIKEYKNCYKVKNKKYLKNKI